MTRNVERLARDLLGLDRRVRSLEFAPQLGNSSIDDAALRLYIDGILRGYFGRLPDGTPGTMPVNGPTPPTPSTPIVTGATGGIRVRWDGLFAGGVVIPMDFQRVEVHVSTVSGFTADPFTTLVTTIESPRGGFVDITYFDTVRRYVVLVARSTSGKASAQSAQASAIPQPVEQRNLGAGLGRFSGSDLTYGDVAPSNPAELDVWFDTTTVPATPYFWSGTAWVEVTGAERTALENSLLAIIARAQLTATGASTSANGKNRNYYQPTMPTGTAYVVGDNWFNTALGYQLSRWSGTAWVLSELGHQAISTLDAGKIVVGELDGIFVKAQTLTARHAVIGSFTNLVIDPSFEGGTTTGLTTTDWSEPDRKHWYRSEQGGTWFIKESTTVEDRRTGKRAAGFTFGTSGLSGIPYLLAGARDNGLGTFAPGSTQIPCRPDEKIYLEAFAGYRGNPYTGSGLQAYISFRRADGSAISAFASPYVRPSFSTAAGGGVTTKLGPMTATAPAETTHVILGVKIAPDNVSSSSTTFYVDDLFARTMMDGSLVVDGSLSARKIGTGTLLADQKITVGIEGGKRIELDGVSGWKFYRDATNVSLHANIATGSVFMKGDVHADTGYFKGDLTGTNMLLGGTLTVNGKLRTAPSGKRVEIGQGTGWQDRVLFWSGFSGESDPGAVGVDIFGSAPRALSLTAPEFGVIGGIRAQIDLQSAFGSTSDSVARILADTVAVLGSDFYFNSQKVMAGAVGNTLGTTDAAGQFTITHGMGATPSSASLTLGHSGTQLGWNVKIVSYSANTMIVQIVRGDNSIPVGVACRVYWQTFA